MEGFSAPIFHMCKLDNEESKQVERGKNVCIIIVGRIRYFLSFLCSPQSPRARVIAFEVRSDSEPVPGTDTKSGANQTLPWLWLE